MTRLPSWIRQHLAALRALAVLTVLLGLVYPLVVTGMAQALLPDQANGSPVTAAGRQVGSRLLGQSFVDPDGRALERYFQPRPSAAGDGYDPTSTSASNLGPEDVLDTLPTPGVADSGRRSLLSRVCARSRETGQREGVDGRRPYCTESREGAVGAVLKVFANRSGRTTRVVSVNQACPAVPFLPTYQGVTVECARPGVDYAAGRTVPVRGLAPAVSAVPADAVTASGSGLDPHISPAYAGLQAARVARARGMTPERVAALVEEYTTGRALGFLGEPTVNVLELNLALDRAVTG